MSVALHDDTCIQQFGNLTYDCSCLAPKRVELMAQAIHAGDCVLNGLGLHEAGDPDAYCTLIAPAVAAEYARLADPNP